LFQEFPPPAFAVFDVSAEPFFLDENLFEAKFENVQAEVARISDRALVRHESPE